MDYTILSRTKFLIEHAEVPCAIPSQNPAERLLAEVSAVIAEQRMFSALLAYSLLREIAP